MRAAITFALVSGCFNPTYNNPSCGLAGECPDGLACNSVQQCVRFNGDDGGNPVDAFGAIVTDAPAACLQWKPHFFSACAIGSPNGPVTLTSGIYTYNTTLGTLVDASSHQITHSTFMLDQGGTPAWGMNVTNLVVQSGATLRVIGTRPLVVAAWETIEIDGMIDASSPTPNAIGQLPSNGGAGLDPASCAASTGGDGQFNFSGAGGGGGGFQGSGGRGGANNATGGLNGNPVAIPRIVRGGCAGGAGGSSSQGVIGYGGLGGGAIQLSAQTTLIVKGTLKASGGGGEAASPGNHGGGGGGGAGGFIGLESSMLALVSGVISANGGGGAASDTGPLQGQNGQDGQPSTFAARGGTTFSGCQSGASGAAGTIFDGQDVSNATSCDGGGGGGGVGYVFLFSNQITQNTTTQSPQGLVNSF